MKSIIKRTIAALITTVLMLSCEQENYEPNLTAAPGGGTVTTYKAYTLSPATADNIYGRVVFYKYSSKVTLVQIGLYNTDEDTDYTASIFKGKAVGAGTSLVVLDAIDGATGAFGTNKFFLINSEGFYDALNAYDASVKVMLSASTVSGGDIGANADPVEEKE
jgi:hypothetical protein